MTVFYNDWGDTASSQEEIISANVARMREEDYLNELSYLIEHDELLKWASQLPEFQQHYAKEIQQAEYEFATSVGWWEEEEDE